MDGFSLPTDDGAIQHALADLEAKLAEWAARMQEAQERLLNASLEAAAPVSTPAPKATSQAEPKPAGKPPPAAAKPPAAQPVARIEPPPTPAAPTVEEPSRATSAEDEALLATLDEKTAQAIRIMRRLNPGRSVKELIDEYRPAAPPEAAAPAAAKKGLWKRIRT